MTESVKQAAEEIISGVASEEGNFYAYAVAVAEAHLEALEQIYWLKETLQMYKNRG